MPGEAVQGESALRALENPLEFASKRGFENLDRIKGLPQTLRQATERLLRVQPALRELDWAKWLPDDADRSDELRKKIRGLKGLVDQARAMILVPSVSRSKPEPKQEAKAEVPNAPRRTAKRGLPGSAQSLGKLRDASTGTTHDQREPQAKARGNALAPASGLRGWEGELTQLKGVGPALARGFQEKGISTLRDLLLVLPRRYEQHRHGVSPDDFEDGIKVSLEGLIEKKHRKRFGGRSVLEVALRVEDARLWLTWFRTPYRGFDQRFEEGEYLGVTGRLKRYRGRWQIAHPELGASLPVDGSDGIVCIYPDSDGLSARQLHRWVAPALDFLPDPDPMPADLLEAHLLPSIAESLRALHHPPATASLDALNGQATPWHHRLIYEELLLLQLSILRKRVVRDRHPGRGVSLADELGSLAKRLFPFSLTSAQARVLGKVEAGLRADLPMSCLVQGDVGSGKTAVALTAAAGVAQAGEQVAIMAPTEILAEQHLRAALKMLTPAGIRVGMLSGSQTASERKETLAHLASGHIQVVVGTHALIQEGVTFKSLALAVVDEQHRFGVMQRGAFLRMGREGRGVVPHILVMTATPIPRTLAMTIYGDLDVAVIDERPPGRKPIQTDSFTAGRRAKAYAQVAAELKQGRQAYVVLPLVEQSDAEGMTEIHSATDVAEELANGWLSDWKVALLHGRMTADDKDSVMRRFGRGEVDVLVSTTVIEVGIDVANATVMVVEHAERFGLSQLHQLRGRVGRGEHASKCILITHKMSSEDARRRIQVMTETDDGFRIAEEDLAIRGPGDFVGTRQSGLPILSCANLIRDLLWLERARDDAHKILSADPELASEEHAWLRRMLATTWAEKESLAQIA